MKNWFMLRVPISSYGCTQEVGEHKRSIRVAKDAADCSSSFLSALQTSQVRALLEKSAIRSSGTRRFSFCASNFLFFLAHWARDQASCLPAKSLKEHTKTFPGQAKFERYLSQGQAGIHSRASGSRVGNRTTTSGASWQCCLSPHSCRSHIYLELTYSFTWPVRTRNVESPEGSVFKQAVTTC